MVYSSKDNGTFLKRFVQIVEEFPLVVKLRIDFIKIFAKSIKLLKYLV